MKNRKPGIIVVFGSMVALSLLFAFLWFIHQQNKELQKSFVESHEALQPRHEVEWLRLLLRLQSEIQNQNISVKHEPYFTPELLRKIKTRPSQAALAPWKIHSIQLQETQALVLSHLPDPQRQISLAAGIQIELTVFSTEINNALGKQIKEARLIKIDESSIQNTFTIPENGYVLIAASCSKNSMPIKWSPFLTKKLREETRESFEDNVIYSALIEVTSQDEALADWSWTCPLSNAEAASASLQKWTIAVKRDKNLQATWINGRFALKIDQTSTTSVKTTRPASNSNYQNLLEQKLNSPKE